MITAQMTQFYTLYILLHVISAQTKQFYTIPDETIISAKPALVACDYYTIEPILHLPGFHAVNLKISPSRL